MRLRILIVVGAALLGSMVTFSQVAAAPTVVDTLQVDGDLVKFAGTLASGSYPTLDFNVGQSKIYDDANLRIATDDAVYLDAWSTSDTQGLYLKAQTGYNRIYDNGQLHINTDDQLYLDAWADTADQGLYLKARTGYNRIYDDAQMHIVTDDYLYLDASNTTYVQNNLNVAGTATVANLTVTGTITPGNWTTTNLTVNGNAALGDAASDTITFNGVAASNLNMNTNLLLNVGNAGTDFNSDGGLTLAGDLAITGGELYLTGLSTSASTTEGTVYYDTDDDNLYVYTSAGWADLTAGAGGANDDLDEAYNNFGATAATVNIDGQEGQGDLEFVLSDVATDRNLIVDMQGDGDFIIQVDNVATHSFRDNGTIDLAGGYGSTGLTITAAGGLSMDGALAVGGNFDLTGSISDSLGDFTIGDNLVVTGTSNLQGNVNADAGVDIIGADLTVGGANFTVAVADGAVTTAAGITAAGDLAVNGDDIDADGDLDVRGATGLNLIATTGTLDVSTTAAADITLTPGAAANLVNVLSGNLKVGNGVNDVALDGEDAYIEGTLEVDGQVQLDGNLNAASGVDVTGADLTVGGANFTVAQATGNITTAGDLAVNGDNITADGTLSVNGATGLSLTTTAGDMVLDSAGSLDVRDSVYNTAGNVVFNDSVNFLGAGNEVTFAPAATFNGNVTINGTTTISSSGTMTIQDPVTITDGNAFQALGNIDLGDSAADQLDVDATSNFDAKATFNGEVDMLWNGTEDLVVASTTGDFASATTMDLFGMDAVVSANTGFATNFDGIDLSITASDEGVVRGMVISQADGAELFDAGIELIANDADAGDEFTAGLVFSGAGTFVTGIDLSAATSTVDLRLDDGLTMSQTSDADLDIVEGGLTLNMDFAETNAATITTSSASSLEYESTADVASALKLEATAGGIDIFASGAAAGEDIDIVATGSSVNVTSTEAAANQIFLDAQGAIAGNAIVAQTTDGGISLDANGAANGDITVNAADVLDMDAANAITLDSAAAGISLDGVTASNFTVTGAADLTLESTLGAVNVLSGESAADALRFNATGVNGGLDVDTLLGGMTFDTTGAISLDSALASNFTVTGAADLTLESTLGAVNVLSGESAADALRFNATGVNGGLDVDTLLGGMTFDTTGAISLDSATASNFTVTGAADLTLSSTLGSVNVTAGEAAANQILLDAQGIVAGNAIVAQTTDGGISLDANGAANGDITVNAADALDMDATNAITLDSAAAGISLDGVTASNFTVTGAAQDLTLSSVGGSVNLSATEAAADAITLFANAEGGAVVIRGGDTADASTADGNDVFVGAEDDLLFDANDDISFVAADDLNFTGDDFTWTLGATGQLIVDAATTDNTTVGPMAGVLKYTIDAAQAATSQNNGMFMDYEAVNDANADQTFVAMNISMTVNEDDAGDTTYAMLLENNAAGASALDALLRLNNADADTAVTTALLIDSSANGGITTAIDINDTDVTTDIQFQNDATLANNTNGDVVLSENARNLTFDFDAVASRIQMSSFSELQVVSSADGAASMTISSDLGGIDITANGASAGEDIDISSTGSSVNISASEAANDAITLFASADTASMTLRAGDNADASTANGNDIFLGAEDDILIDANGDVDFTANILDMTLSGDSIWAMANTAAFVEIDAATVDSTTTTGIFDMNVDAGNAAVDALNIDLEAINGIAAGTNITAMEVLLTASDADADMFGMTITGAATAVAGAGSYEAGIVIDSAEETVGGMTDGVLVTASGGNGSVTDAFDGSAVNINNALNAGDNVILGAAASINFNNFDVADDGGILIAAGQELDTQGAGALSIGNTNATSLVLGGAAVTSITMTTDNTGDGTDLVLPAQGVNGSEVLNDTLSFAQMADSLDLDANTSFNNTAGGFSLTLGDNQGAVVINSNDWDINASGDMTGIGAITADGTVTVNGIFDANNAVTLGDNGESVAIDSNAWDIDANGVVTGIRSITAAAASTYDLGSNTTEWDQIFIGDANGIEFGLDQDAVLAWDNTDGRLELNSGSGAGTNDGKLFVANEFGLGVQAYTVTDDGVANDTLTPTASYVELTQDATANAGTPDVVIDETGALEGDLLVVVRIDAVAGDVTINEVDGVNEQAGALTLNTAEFDSITYIYTGTTWVELARSNNG